MHDGSPFKGFGEAAKLYARYVSVVDQVHAEFLKDTAAFVDALKAEIKARVKVQLREECCEGKEGLYRRWWLAEDTQPYDKHVYVWLYTDRPEIIMPGMLKVSPYAYPIFKTHRHRLTAVKEELRLPATCQVRKALDGVSLFTVEVAYGDDDSINAAAQPIADLLTALCEAEQALPK